MSKTMHDVPTDELVGTYIYSPYTPLNIGKIIEIPSDDQLPERYRGSLDNRYVKIKWMKPLVTGQTETVEWADSFNNFQALIDDHAKKLKNHKARLEEAKEILG